MKHVTTIIDVELFKLKMDSSGLIIFDAPVFCSNLLKRSISLLRIISANAAIDRFSLTYKLASSAKKSLLGSIHRHQTWGYTYSEYEKDIKERTIPNAIVKIWTGR